MGLKSGEYGGKNSSTMPALSQSLCNTWWISDAEWYHSTSVRWIGALSITMTDRGSGYGLQSGKTLFLMKSSNNSPENEPWTISHVMKPSIVYAGHRDQRSERPKGLASRGVTPTGAQPYFWSAVRSFTADSSMNMSCSAVHSDSLLIHCLLSSGFCCAAHNCIYKLDLRLQNPVRKAKYMYLLFWPLRAFEHALNALLVDLDTEGIP